MPTAITIDRTARAKALVAAAHQAREDWRATTKATLERKVSALRALTAIFVAQDAAQCLLDYSDEAIAALISQIELRARADNAVTHTGESVYSDLIKAGLIVICSDGRLDVPSGPLAPPDPQTAQA